METEQICLTDLAFRDKSALLDGVKLIVELLNQKLISAHIEVVECPPHGAKFIIHEKNSTETKDSIPT